ncbi:MAG: hypothetical protein H0W33_01490 [Gammaproteobacteria bacterium]|nr:hypothetical protein [Gammaproteobacteria bacterium]
MGDSEIDTDVFEDELVKEMLRFVEEGTASDEETVNDTEKPGSNGG